MTLTWHGSSRSSDRSCWRARNWPRLCRGAAPRRAAEVLDWAHPAAAACVAVAASPAVATSAPGWSPALGARSRLLLGAHNLIPSPPAIAGTGGALRATESSTISVPPYDVVAPDTVSGNRSEGSADCPAEIPG